MTEPEFIEAVKLLRELQEGHNKLIGVVQEMCRVIDDKFEDISSRLVKLEETRNDVRNS